VNKYKVINLLSCAVTIVMARNVYDAIKEGQNHFTEPNRTTAKVQVIGVCNGTSS